MTTTMKLTVILVLYLLVISCPKVSSSSSSATTTTTTTRTLLSNNNNYSTITSRSQLFNPSTKNGPTSSTSSSSLIHHKPSLLSSPFRLVPVSTRAKLYASYIQNQKERKLSTFDHSSSFFDHSVVSNLVHRIQKPPITTSTDCITQSTKVKSAWRTVPRGGGGGGNGGYDPNDGDDDKDNDYYSNPYDPYGNNNNNYYNNNNYNDDFDYYDDRGYSSQNTNNRFGGGSNNNNFNNMIPAMIRTGNRQIGIPLLGVGGILTLFGISLFFNKTLMRLGNLCFVLGAILTLGPGRTASYFLQPKKARATACLLLGIMLVFVGWPIIGIILEVFGLLNLFGNMFPLAMAILRQMPVIGPILKGNIGRNNYNNNKRDDYNYYDDDGRYYGGNDDTYQDRGRYYDEPFDTNKDKYRDDDDNNAGGYY